MSKSKSMKVNFIMNAALNVALVLYSLLTFQYVSRVLQPTNYGKVNLAASFIEYFNIFAQIGIPTYGIRACAKVRDNKDELSRTAQELLIINLATSLITYALFALSTLIIPKVRNEKALYIVMSSAIFLNTVGMEWLFKALEHYSYITLRSIFFKAVSVISMYFLIRSEEDYLFFGILTVFANSAGYLVNLAVAGRYIHFKPMGHYNFRRHYRAILTFFLMACATTIYTNLNTVMLGFMTTEADVGIYSVAVRVKAVLVSLVTSLGAVLLPRCSYYIEKRQMDEFRKISEKALRFVIIAAASVSLYFILFARPGILFLSGESYEASILPMQITMPTVLLIGLTNLLGLEMLVPMGKERVVLISEIAAAVVDLVLNALLIPRFRSTGAAIAALVAETVVLVIQYRELRDEVLPVARRIRWSDTILALAAGGLASFWVLRLSMGSLMTLMLSAVLFFAVYVAVLLLRRDPFMLYLLNFGVEKCKKLFGRQ